MREFDRKYEQQTTITIKYGYQVGLTFWRRIFFQILAHPVFKM